jgi:hypothetical protein
MKKVKRFDYSYYVPYDPNIQRPVAPYNLVVLAKGEKEDGRLTMSYKRPLYNAKSDIKKEKEPIGQVTYLFHVHTVNIDSAGTKGTMRADFTAHHSFTKKYIQKSTEKSIEYDIMYTGQVEWRLGIRSGSNETIIDTTKLEDYIINIGEVDTITAVSVLRNGIKINHGNNLATLKNGGEYRVKGVVEKYDF